MPKPLAAICAILTLLIFAAACDAEDIPADPYLTWDEPLQPGITWNLQSLNGNRKIDGTSITMRLSESSISGYDGCNSYWTSFFRDDPPRYVAFITNSDGSSAEGIFSFHSVISTLAGCREDINEQSDAYYEALGGGKRFRIKGNWLEITDDENQPTLVFSRPEPLPGYQPGLAGTHWRMEGNRKSVDLGFLDDKNLAIIGECLNRIARYGADGRFFFLQSHHTWDIQEGCAEDSTDNLWGAQQYSVSGDEGSEKLLIGTRSEKTLTLEAGPKSSPDEIEMEWALEKFVDVSPHESGLPRIWDVILGSTVTMNIQGSSVSGSAGCNAYQATFEIDGETITIGPISSTALTCTHLEFFERVMDQESRYLALRPQVTRGVTIGDRLFLSTGTGIYLIFKAQ